MLVAMAACAYLDSARLESARSRWRAASVADYSFRYRTTGFAERVDIRVTVAAGRVTDVERLGGALDVAEEAAPTIDALFDEIALSLDDGDVHVSVGYDAALGYPVTVTFDYGGEADGFDVSEFVSSS